MLLPSGIAGLQYNIHRSNISWSVKIPTGYQPHGVVRLNASGQIASATTFSGPGAPLKATVSYPRNVSAIAAPRKLC
jgi:hypothetical protein